MHKKGIVTGGVVGVLASIGVVLAGSNVLATVTCGNPNSAGVSTCTDLETGAITYKTSASATASVTVSAACSFSRVGNTSEYSDTLVNNGDALITGSTFTTTCNDTSGYAIYAVGYSNNTLGSTDLIFNNTPSSANNITTSSSPASGTSYWQMKLTAATENQPVLENGYENYSAIPSSYTKIASYSSITDPASSGTGTGQSVTAHYKAHASTTQPAGTYTGAVKYTMVHPGNTPAPIKMIDDLEYMQDFATLTSAEKTSVLNSMIIDTQYILTDSRDGESYYIAKLADGNIWMTQNLDLDLAADDEFTHDDTDLGWSTGNIDPDAKWIVGSGYGTVSWDSVNDAFTGWVDDTVHPYSADPGDIYYYTSNTNSDDTKFNSLQQCLNANHTDAECKHYKAGNYYNWTTATATNDSSSYTDNTRASNSICPAGWRLPTRLPANEFGALLVEYDVIPTASSSSYKTNSSFNALRNFPLYYVRSGRVSSGSLNNAGSLGSYWTNSGYYKGSAISLHFNSNTANTTGANSNAMGHSIRCVAR